MGFSFIKCKIIVKTVKKKFREENFFKKRKLKKKKILKFSEFENK